VLQPWFASIPSPSHNIVHLGPLPLHMYGICVAVGVLVAVKIADVRWVKRGYPKGEIGEIAVWLVLAGAVGARVYHLFTGYNWDTGGIAGAFEVWKGGLSIWGAIIGGFIAAMIVAHRRHMDKLALMDAVAPGLLAAQAIGRWGNYFNQEIFGRPTKLPWALEIDAAHRVGIPLRYQQFTTFQPTFLYESLYCLLVLALLLVLERRFRLRKGQTFAAYVTLYCFGRIFFESMRIDKASKVFGLRFNGLLSAALCLFGAGWFIWLGRRAEGVYPDLPSDARPVDASGDAVEALDAAHGDAESGEADPVTTTD
jgi:prolipoprotein diacylglyceryl transferase